MAMSKAQKNKFVKNRVHLINHIIPSEEFCSYLEAGNHMSAAMKEEIMLERTTKSKVGKILDMMSRRSARAFDAFVEALVMTDQEHAAEVLHHDLTMELVRKRDAERGMNSQPISQPLSPSSHSAVVPSGAAVTTSSSTANVSSFHTNPAPTPTPATVTTTSAASQVQPSSNAYAPGTSAAVQPSPEHQPIQAMDTSDVRDVVDAVIGTGENMSLIDELSQQKPTSHRHPEAVIKNGHAVVIQNPYISQECGASGITRQLSTSVISSFVMDSFLQHSGFKKPDLQTELTAEALRAKIQNVRDSDELKSCDAFVFFFMGFGNYQGHLFGTDGQLVSIKTDILQIFNAVKCPALQGKPKIFCFQLAMPVGSGDEPMDIVDGVLGKQLLPSEQWSDMIIFSSVTPIHDSNPNISDFSHYMHRAMIRVAYKFSHELSVYDMLNKVEAILKNQAVASKIGSSGIHTELYHSPDSRPVYLQLAAKS